MVGFVLGFPGAVAALYTFGVHNGGGFDVTAYAAVTNAVVYGELDFFFFLFFARRPRRNPEATESGRRQKGGCPYQTLSHAVNFCYQAFHSNFNFFRFPSHRSVCRS
jgi:hypothetical protein